MRKASEHSEKKIFPNPITLIAVLCTAGEETRFVVFLACSSDERSKQQKNSRYITSDGKTTKKSSKAETKMKKM